MTVTRSGILVIYRRPGGSLARDGRVRSGRGKPELEKFVNTESTKKPYHSPAEPEVIISVATAENAGAYYDFTDGPNFYSSTGSG